MDARDQRAICLAAMCKIDRKDGHWLVPSQSEPNKTYTVSLDGENGKCNCPDHEKGFYCKHVRTVRIVLKRELGMDGGITETRSITLEEKRTTYPQVWSAYNIAQATEKKRVQVLLQDLCRNLPEPEYKTGRRPHLVRDAVFAMVFKTYCGFSARRFQCDLNDAHANGFLIAFKANTTGAVGRLFAKMFSYFKYRQEDFMKHYHKRSNVESTFSSVKRKFGDSVRSKTDTAMVNEVLCKLLCHNLCCLIQEQCELGIEPVFWPEDGKAPEKAAPSLLLSFSPSKCRRWHSQRRSRCRRFGVRPCGWLRARSGIEGNVGTVNLRYSGKK
jgi:hypothetical protein